MLTRIPSLLTDISVNFGQDIVLGPSGRIVTANLGELSQQRVLRRLLTSLSGYIWHPTYGSGIPATIGLPLTDDNFSNIKAIIMANILSENSVAEDPAPVIYITTIQGGLFCQINYTVNPTLQPIVLNFNLSGAI